ncbi:MAG: glutathione S-transferase [Gammaproteobacteria bacterium]|nr:glutathione S-transferase [Gammaproteobacteria bacterium]
MPTPILYSFRRCPYCMRAHMALKQSGIKVELREVKLSDMPDEALAASPEATVPVLILPDGTVFTESWDIVKWSLLQNDPEQWLGNEDEYSLDAEILIETNDFSFKDDLDHYKYADRFPERNKEDYRKACEEFIEELEDMLTENHYLLADQLSLADIGVFPFVRQFSLVDKDWFDASPYTKVQHWLGKLIRSELFQHVFQKHKLWETHDAAIYI